MKYPSFFLPASPHRWQLTSRCSSRVIEVYWGRVLALPSEHARVSNARVSMEINQWNALIWNLLLLGHSTESRKKNKTDAVRQEWRTWTETQFWKAIDCNCHRDEGGGGPWKSKESVLFAFMFDYNNIKELQDFLNFFFASWKKSIA